MRFQIKTLVYITTVAAVLIGWYADRRNLRRQVEEAREAARLSERKLADSRQKFESMQDVMSKHYKKQMERLTKNFRDNEKSLIDQFNQKMKRDAERGEAK